MAGVTELRVRADWGFVKFAYLPALVAGIAASKYLVPAVAMSVRAAPCAICVLFSRWAHHLEEWYNCKPLLRITDTGLRYEDGGEALEYDWGDVLGVIMHRRNTIPPWRTNGSVAITPPFWLSITVRGEPRRTSDGYVDRSRYLEHYSNVTAETVPSERRVGEAPAITISSEGYIDRSRYLDSDSSNSSATGTGDGEDVRTICVWPRQVVGGLFSLMRFAKELQRHLLERADSGEIPMLIDRPKGPPPERLRIMD